MNPTKMRDENGGNINFKIVYLIQTSSLTFQQKKKKKSSITLKKVTFLFSTNPCTVAYFDQMSQCVLDETSLQTDKAENPRESSGLFFHCFSIESEKSAKHEAKYEAACRSW